MSLKFKGGFRPVTGAMKTGNKQTVITGTPHRYWRLISAAPIANSDIVEIEMFEQSVGGDDVTDPSFASADSEFSGSYIAGNAFNNTTDIGAGSSDPGNRWNTLIAGGAASPWIMQDFGEGNEKAIKRVEIIGGAGTSTLYWQLQYSDDGVFFSTFDEIISVPQFASVTMNVPEIILLSSPELVPTTSGLIFNLDSGNTASYTEGSSTWTDLTGNYSTTLLAGSGFYPAAVAGGAIDFDGSSSGANVGSLFDNISQGSVEIWFKPKSTPAVGGNVYQYPTLFNKGAVYASLMITNTYHIKALDYNPGYGSYDSVGTAPLDTWSQVVYTWNSSGSTIYLNGAFDSSSASVTWENISYTSAWVGQSAMIGHNEQNGTDNFDGHIPIVRAYDDVLTAGEVTANYNALAPRFGL